MKRSTIPWCAAALAGCAHLAPSQPTTAERMLSPEQASTAAATREDPAEAIDRYLRAAAARPEDQALLSELVATAAAQDQLPRALAGLQPRDDATGLWYRGQLHFLMADQVRVGGDHAFALDALDAAMDCFARSMRENDTYRDTCEAWLAMCLGKKGNVAFRVGDLDRAEAWLLEAVRLRPDHLETDLGSAETIKLGLLRVGDKTMRDFARTEALFRTAAAAAGTDLDLLNNAAVYARDLGTRLARSGRVEEATTLYERSYETYGRAVQLDPRNVRLRNDCALIAIHHLECDWSRSKRLLDTAIADGEAMLRDAPPADARARQDLDEAVGDCYENLALWHLKHGEDARAAKAAAARSLRHHPGDARAGARRHLQAAEQRLLAR